MSEPADDYQPIAALNDLLFCERRCAMHRIEGVWSDNPYTVEGTHAHKRAHATIEVQSAAGIRAVHGVLLKSVRLRLVGKADVIEFHVPASRTDTDGSFNLEPTATANRGMANTVAVGSASNDVRHSPSSEVPYPVEYKRGRRRRWDNDDVQLCAQALCLEEMLGLTEGGVPAGAIFHVKSKRRREIVFTPDLRATTEAAARRLHDLVASAATPPPVLKPRCRGCSLRELCMPELLQGAGRIRQYHGGLFVVS